MKTVYADNLPTRLQEYLRTARDGTVGLSRESGVSARTIQRVLLAAGSKRMQARTWRRLNNVLCGHKRTRDPGGNPFLRLDYLVKRSHGLDGEPLMQMANAALLLCMDIFRHRRIPCSICVDFDGHDTRRYLSIQVHPLFPCLEISVVADSRRLMYEWRMVFVKEGATKCDPMGDLGSSIIKRALRVTAAAMRRVRRGEVASAGEEFRRKLLIAQAR